MLKKFTFLGISIALVAGGTLIIRSHEEVESLPLSKASFASTKRANSRRFLADGETLPNPWQLMNRSVTDYMTEYEDRPIIVSYGANWTMTSQHQWHTLLTPKVCEMLKSWDGLCLIGDFTRNPDLVHNELSQFQRSALPVTAVYSPQQNRWTILSQIIDEGELARATSESFEYKGSAEQDAAPQIRPRW